MIELDNKTSLEVNEQQINRIALSLTKRSIELIVCSDSDIKAINYEYRGIDKATDVLSFPYDDMPMAPLGSIVISKKSC
jgi:probable rRNA maturation factor